MWFSQTRDSIYRHCCICNSLHPEDFLSLLDIYECKLIERFYGYPSEFKIDRYTFAVQHFADLGSYEKYSPAMKLVEEKTGISLSFDSDYQ